MIRSVLSLLAGLATVVVLVGLTVWLGAAALGAETGPPSPLYPFVNLAVSLAAGVAGGYVAARTAPRAPLVHALGLAVVVVTFSFLALGRLTGPGRPSWYPVVFTVLGPVAVLAGGGLWARRALPPAR